MIRAASSKRAVRRELLDRIARPLLCELLAPYASYLLSNDLSLDDLSATRQTDRRLVHRLYDLLHAGDPRFPSELRAALLAIAPVATAAGQQAIVGLSPELAARRLGPEDLAVTAFLRHPELFRAARRGAPEADGAEPFTDFLLAPSAAAPVPSLNRESLAALEADLSAWLDARGRSKLCRVHATDAEGELHLEIEHGRPPKSDDVVGDDLALTQQTVVTTQRAHVVFDREAARLSVHAFPALKDALRRLVGAHLFGHAHVFTTAAVYTLAPLADPDAALATRDIPGLEAIELRAATVRFPRSRVTYESPGADLRDTERAAEMRDALRTGAVEWAKLWVKVEGRARPTSIELSPSRKKYLRTAPEVERVLHELLLARGMMLLPGRRSETSAAAIAATA